MYIQSGRWTLEKNNVPPGCKHPRPGWTSTPGRRFPWPGVLANRLYYRIERPEEAIIDAEKALNINNCSTRAIIAKAEALYNLGQFEKALVQFERGWRVRQDPEIKIGIVKCRDVILNTVGANAGEYDIKVVEKVIQQMKEIKEEFRT